MSLPSDIRVTGVSWYLLPVQTRVPLKFGTETLRHVTCLRAKVRVEDRQGRIAEGWGETPLSVQWGWPSPRPYEPRLAAMVELSRRVAKAWCGLGESGHPIELGWDFVESVLPSIWTGLNADLLVEAAAAVPATGAEAAGTGEPMPWLAALICAAAFDVALHDAFGRVLGRPVYTIYGREFLRRDLADFLAPAEGAAVDFRGRAPADYLQPRQDRLPAWHLVGGLDAIGPEDLRGDEPADGHPVLLDDWIRRDGLKCLKVKLRGNDEAWDYARLRGVGDAGIASGVDWLTADFNCTVGQSGYVTGILDRLCAESPRVYGMLLYVEQPFPYDLEANRLDVHGVSARKPLFLDESAHDWRVVRLGRSLGWTGVALKTCKTQTGALLSLCWARAHGMTLMVQDLTNPMLSQLSHLLLAAHAGTIMGVETNSMQFYPAASAPEERIHPGCFRRREGMVDLSTLRGGGFGYRLEEIGRDLPPPGGVEGS